MYNYRLNTNTLNNKHTYWFQVSRTLTNFHVPAGHPTVDDNSDLHALDY